LAGGLARDDADAAEEVEVLGGRRLATCEHGAKRLLELRVARDRVEEVLQVIRERSVRRLELRLERVEARFVRREKVQRATHEVRMAADELEKPSDAL